MLPPSQVSWIGSIQIFLTFAISAFSGRSADAGYARHAVLAGTFFCVLGTFMTSLAKTYWQIFLAQGICEGIGMGIMYMPAVTGRQSPNASVAFQVLLRNLKTSLRGLCLRDAAYQAMRI